MLKVITKHVGPMSSTDYETLQECLDEQYQLRPDLVSSNEKLVIFCHSFGQPSANVPPFRCKDHKNVCIKWLDGEEWADWKRLQPNEGLSDERTT